MDINMAKSAAGAIKFHSKTIDSIADQYGEDCACFVEAMSMSLFMCRGIMSLLPDGADVNFTAEMLSNILVVQRGIGEKAFNISGEQSQEMNELSKEIAEQMGDPAHFA